MIYPSVEELTHNGKYNRYMLVIATAKCARMVTDEYVKQRETAEKMLSNKETDKSLSSMIKKEYRDEKAVKSAIKRLYQGEYTISDRSVSLHTDETEESAAAAENAAAAEAPADEAPAAEVPAEENE